ncbi:MAG: DUF922 domain-containing protein [Candidatus Omnitrophica bacterium]|nr:DUF922 domain-containing protein [Candidatus Omnitrophota bacterium]
MKVIYCQECLYSLFAEPLEAVEESAPDKSGLEYIYYKIQGASFSELKQDIFDRRGPLTSNGQRVSFYTCFHLRWKYDSTYTLKLQDSDDTVVLAVAFKNIVISISHKTTAPVLGDAVKLPSRDLDLWQRYFDKLKQHELDHVSISSDSKTLEVLKTEVASIKEVKFGFNNLPPRSKSLAGDIIALAVNTVGNKYTSLIQKRYELFDELTKNGEEDYNKDEVIRKVFEATI